MEISSSIHSCKASLLHCNKRTHFAIRASEVACCSLVRVWETHPAAQRRERPHYIAGPHACQNTSARCFSELSQSPSSSSPLLECVWRVSRRKFTYTPPGTEGRPPQRVVNHGRGRQTERSSYSTVQIARALSLLQNGHFARSEKWPGVPEVIYLPLMAPWAAAAPARGTVGEDLAAADAPYDHPDSRVGGEEESEKERDR